MEVPAITTPLVEGSLKYCLSFRAEPRSCIALAVQVGAAAALVVVVAVVDAELD